MYDKLATEFNAIDTKILSTSGLFSNTQCDLDKQSLEKKKIQTANKKIPSTPGLVKEINYNTKTTEIEIKMLFSIEKQIDEN